MKVVFLGETVVVSVGGIYVRLRGSRMNSGRSVRELIEIFHVGFSYYVVDDVQISSPCFLLYLCVRYTSGVSSGLLTIAIDALRTFNAIDCCLDVTTATVNFQVRDGWGGKIFGKK